MYGIFSNKNGNIFGYMEYLFFLCERKLNEKEMMVKYFSIIQALVRCVVNYDKEIATHQVKRLIESFKQDGFEQEAKSLNQILVSASKISELKPQNLTFSSTLSGERLTNNTPIPVDKETSAPILEVIFPNMISITDPLYDDAIFEAIESIVLEWKNYGELVKMKTTPSRSCLIFGEPGTGKTNLAYWIAQKLNLPIVSAKLEGIVSSFLGTSSRNIGNLFKFANRYQCILLLDEFDAIAKLRNDPQEVGEVKRIVNTLLQCLDERDRLGFTIGITNHEQLLDPAVWRRFDVQVEMPKPSPKVITELVKSFMLPMEISDADLKFLTWCLKDSSGADVEKLCNWLKRMKIIEQYKDESLLDLMKRYALLNTGRISISIRNILDSNNDDIMSDLLNSDLNLKQKELASIFNVTQSSLSKQISKLKKD